MCLPPLFHGALKTAGLRLDRVQEFVFHGCTFADPESLKLLAADVAAARADQPVSWRLEQCVALSNDAVAQVAATMLHGSRPWSFTCIDCDLDRKTVERICTLMYFSSPAQRALVHDVHLQDTALDIDIRGLDVIRDSKVLERAMAIPLFIVGYAEAGKTQLEVSGATHKYNQ